MFGTWGEQVYSFIYQTALCSPKESSVFGNWRDITKKFETYILLTNPMCSLKLEWLFYADILVHRALTAMWVVHRTAKRDWNLLTSYSALWIQSVSACLLQTWFILCLPHRVKQQPINPKEGTAAHNLPSVSWSRNIKNFRNVWWGVNAA